MIYLEHLTKKYKKYTAPYNSFKSFMLHYRQYQEEMERIEELCVVKDMTLHIGKSEVLCIAGRNGAGKSTLVKLIAQTVDPTSGTVRLNGSVVPFLELGVAFNSELSGRDNAVMNGVLLGMKRIEVKEQMEEIFAYAGIMDFMDTPLKFYSSGMLMRLAFSIGMHAHGDIYIFDEILAVGDADFQKKCFRAFEDLISEGKTIILITHDLNLISEYATRVLLLENGKYCDIKDTTEIRVLKNKNLDEIYKEKFYK